jgi:hypothetical protein
MTEFQEQKEVVAWFRDRYPKYAKCLRLSLNGLNLGGGKKAAMIINQIKSQGAVLGEADLVILMPRMGYGALVIEHKAENDKKGPSDEQLDYIGYHNMIGNKALVTKGVQQFKDAILEYMNNKEEQ